MRGEGPRNASSGDPGLNHRVSSHVIAIVVVYEGKTTNRIVDGEHCYEQPQANQQVQPGAFRWLLLLNLSDRSFLQKPSISSERFKRSVRPQSWFRSWVAWRRILREEYRASDAPLCRSCRGRR